MWPTQEGSRRVRRGDPSVTTSWIAGKAVGRQQAGIGDGAVQDGFTLRQVD